MREATEDTRAGELTGRVLVAEDNKVNQMLVRKMLEKQGLVVEMAGNGVEAVDYINDVASGEKLPVDLILMDVQMPEMDGIEATRLIREREDDLSGIPILAVTANAMSEQAEEYHQAGMDGFVSKPIDFMLLKAEIRKILEAGDQD